MLEKDYYPQFTKRLKEIQTFLQQEKEFLKKTEKWTEDVMIKKEPTEKGGEQE